MDIRAATLGRGLGRWVIVFPLWNGFLGVFWNTGVSGHGVGWENHGLGLRIQKDQVVARSWDLGHLLARPGNHLAEYLGKRDCFRKHRVTVAGQP